jgi:uncharacterized protein YecE (DUF72 family)
MNGTIHIGPAGWSYPDWRGTVYPPDPVRGFDPLEYMARYFDAIEINSTFYRIPSISTSKNWAKRTAFNPDFLFTVKAHRDITHLKTDLAPSVVDEFKSSVTPILEEGKLGFVLAQFPWSFKDTPESRRRIELLARTMKPFPLAVEVRHGSWSRKEAVDFISRLGITLCGIDQPVIGNSFGPGTHFAGPSGAYFRFHGRNSAEWFSPDANRDSRYDYLYSRTELEEWSRKIKEAAKCVERTFVIMNNHFRGQAAANALEMKAALSGRKVSVPDTLAATYARLQACSAGDCTRESGRNEQISLFEDEEEDQKQDDPG